MILRKIKAAPAPSAVAAGSQILTLDSPEGWLQGIDPSLSSEDALKLSAVYACVEYICDFYCALPMYVFDTQSRKRITDHELHRVLNVRPNPYQTPSAFKRYSMRCMLLRGSGYSYNYRDPKSGRVVERVPLHPDCVSLEWLDGKLLYVYSHPTTGKQYAFDSEEISHYKMGSRDGYTGVSPLHYASRTLAKITAGEEYEASVYRNNSQPGGVLTTDTDLSGFSEVQDPNDKTGTRFLTRKENLRRAWERAHGGSANTARIAILDNGLEYKPIKIDPYDQSFVLSKEVSVADIARFFMVPLHAIMAGKQTYASNEQNNLEFIQGHGMALLKMVEEEDSYKLLFDSDLNRLRIKHNLDGRLRGDTAARANYYRTMHDIGAYSVDDILELEDRPSVPGGHVRKASLNFVPLDQFEALSIARNANQKKEVEP